jgi:molybdopterin-guanine dinucleotide biosynthesis protein A
VDKARFTIQGRPQIVRLIEQLRCCDYRVVVVADAEHRYADLGIECLRDLQPGTGPASALLASMRHRQLSGGDGWLLCVGCDQFLWRDSWLRSGLQAASVESAAPLVQAVTFAKVRGKHAGSDEAAITHNERTSTLGQPLPALYHSSSLALLLESQEAKTGRVSLRQLLSRLPVAEALVDEHPQAWSFNTRLELEQLLRKQADAVESRSER